MEKKLFVRLEIFQKTDVFLLTKKKAGINSYRAFLCSFKIKIKLHTDHAVSAQRCHKLGISQNDPCSVQQREPAGVYRQHQYYTALKEFCKYSIVTKIREYFCGKAYEVEFFMDSEKKIVCFSNGHGCRTEG